MANEFVARRGLISLSTSSFYGPVNFSGSSLVGIGTGSVLFTNASGSVTGSGNLVWDNVNGRLGVGLSNPSYTLHATGSTGVSNFYATGPTVNIGQNGVMHTITLGGTDQYDAKVVIGRMANLTFNVGNWSGANNIIFSKGYSSGLMQIFGATGNITIQNGGTLADVGYRLDVDGTGASSGALRANGSSMFSGSVNVTGNIVLTNSGYTAAITKTHTAGGSGWGTITFSYDDIILSQNANGNILYMNGLYGTVSVRGNSNRTSDAFSIQGGKGTALGIYNSAGSTSLFKVLDTSNVLVNTGTDFGYRVSINTTSAPSGSLFITGSTTQPAALGNSLTSVNIVPTMVFTTGSQTQTAFKVMPTFSGSAAFTSSQTNIIADFGATSVGSQLIVTDVTSGSIYMVNDVSGIPIIEANSNWDVLMYDYPYTVFKKTGSAVELGVAGQASSSVTLKSDLVINEGLGFIYRQAQASGSTNGAVTSSLYNITFTNTSASVYINAIVTGYDTGSRDTIAGDIKATIRYRSGVASIVGIDQTFINTDNSVVGFDIVAGGTSGSLVAFGTGSRVYQWGATITTQVI